MVLAIDFDNTIHDSKNKLPGYKMGQPMPQAVEVINKLYEKHTIIIFTARDVQNAAVKRAVAEWLQYFGIPYHGITNIKSSNFDLIIDDRAVRFTNWNDLTCDLDF